MQHIEIVSNALAAAATRRKDAWVVDNVAASSMHKTVSAAVLDEAMTPKRER
jgi:hypothetical protein